MTTKRSLILQWSEAGAIPPDRVDDALANADLLPTPQSWRQFIDLLLLWSGALALAFAAIFFFAFNWDAMGRITKFGLLEASVVITLAGYWRAGSESMMGKAMLMAAALLVGALLALFGQTYQTGADPWQLFAYWALAISPWVFVGRFAALWLMLIGLINLSLYLYFNIHRGFLGLFFNFETLMLLSFLFNTSVLILWELSARRYAWLAERWAIRILAVASGCAITFLMLQTIFDWRDTSTWSSLLYPCWIGGFYWTYRNRIKDLFMLAGLSLSTIVVVTALLARGLLENANAGGFLLITLAIVGMSAVAAMWLKRIHREHEQ